MSYHIKFVRIVGIVNGVALAAVNGYFLVQANESSLFILFFAIPVVIICFAGGFLIAEAVWRFGSKYGFIKQ